MGLRRKINIYFIEGAGIKINKATAFLKYKNPFSNPRNGFKRKLEIHFKVKIWVCTMSIKRIPLERT